jgi:hypothetical protein
VAAVAEGGGGRRRSSGRGDRLERRYGGDLESFGMKSETTRGGILFIGLKISATIIN